MQTQLASPMWAAQPRPSPVEIWQILLSYLFEQHYGLMLNETPLGDDVTLQEHIDAGISVCDAVNVIVEKYDLLRIDRRSLSMAEPSALLNSIDILRARKASGLMSRDGYKTITEIIRGQYAKSKA